MIKLNTVLEYDDYRKRYGYTSINLEDAASIIKKYNIDINEIKFYRGMASKDKFLKFNSINTDRPSKDDPNYVNLLVSNILPSWKHLPKRSKSLIGTESETHAKKFSIAGSVYYVFPYEKVSGIAILNKSDLYDKKNFRGINRFFMYLSKFVPGHTYYGSVDINNVTNIISFANKNSKSIYDLFIKKDDTNLSESVSSIMTLWYNTKFMPLENLIDQLFNSHDINLVETVNDIKSEDGNSELWTEDSCLLINSNAYDIILTYLRENK